jgi:four helix bundle protein
LEVGGEKVRGEGQTKTAERYVFPFEKLEVWQKSVELADFVLGLLEHVPQGRHLRLVSQMEGAAVSVAQNIAEGKGRQHRKEFLQYLSIAQGSFYETVTLNELFRIRKLFDEGECVEIRSRAEHIDRKLNGLMNSVRGKKREEWGRG